MRCLGVFVGLLVLPACLPELHTSFEEAEVLGGTNAPLGKWPDVASVRESGQGSCTGTLIAPTVVLTAGHCYSSAVDSVLVGTNSLARAQDGEVISVVKKVPYGGSAGAAFRSADLSVLVLARESKYEPRAIASGWARYDIKDNATIYLVGYGAIDSAGNEYVPDLREATTRITDADCSSSSGCNSSVKPNGELGAGGMGIDTCYGDSGGPLYLPTDYGIFLAGATSRGYDNNQLDCSEGGIYVRPDKFVAWIEEAAGVPVRRGPAPTAELAKAVRGLAAEVDIVHNDPRSDDHDYAIKTAPMYGRAAVRDDGRVRVCTNDNVAGGDSMVVTVTDKNDPTRTEEVKINILIEDGDPGSNCDPEAFGEDDGGGCCDSGRSPAGAMPLSLVVLAFLVRRRRRR